jgi:hypothetical protein
MPLLDRQLGRDFEVLQAAAAADPSMGTARRYALGGSSFNPQEPSAVVARRSFVYLCLYDFARKGAGHEGNLALVAPNPDALSIEGSDFQTTGRNATYRFGSAHGR